MTTIPFPIGPLGEPEDRRAWSNGIPPCGPCGRGEHDECKGAFFNFDREQECWCPVCYPDPSRAGSEASEP